MVDNSKMVKPEFGDVPGEMAMVVETLHRAGEVLRTADQTPDEAVKKPLLDGARQMIKNCLDAVDGRRTDGLVDAPEDEEE